MNVVYRSSVVWPPNQKKTAVRKFGQYGGSSRYKMALSTACSRVVNEVRKCTQKGHNWRTRELVICVDGAKHYVNGSGFCADSRPTWPGVVVQFDLDGDEIVLACDTCTDACQNLCAIAATVEDLRRAERNGVLTLKQMLGAQALPEPMGRAWWVVLGVMDGSSREVIERAYRDKARYLHPDAGGSHEAMAELNVAYEQAKEALCG